MILQINILVMTGIVLDCVVVNRVVPDFVHVLDWGTDYFVQFAAFLLL